MFVDVCRDGKRSKEKGGDGLEKRKEMEEEGICIKHLFRSCTKRNGGDDGGRVKLHSVETRGQDEQSTKLRTASHSIIPPYQNLRPHQPRLPQMAKPLEESSNIQLLR